MATLKSDRNVHPVRPAWPEYREDQPLHHVTYELDMLFFTAEWLSASPRGSNTNEILLTNAVLESFGVHARSLIHFFGLTPCNTHADDLMAYQFVANVELWQKSRDGIQFDYSVAVSKANKRIAHLTNVRLDEEDKGWSLEIAEKLLLQEIIFYNHLQTHLKEGAEPLRQPVRRNVDRFSKSSFSSSGTVTVSSFHTR